jgi:hypothetical protein
VDEGILRRSGWEGCGMCWLLRFVREEERAILEFERDWRNISLLSSYIGCWTAVSKFMTVYVRLKLYMYMKMKPS